MRGKRSNKKLRRMYTLYAQRGSPFPHTACTNKNQLLRMRNPLRVIKLVFAVFIEQMKRQRLVLVGNSKIIFFLIFLLCSVHSFCHRYNWFPIRQCCMIAVFFQLMLIERNRTFIYWHRTWEVRNEKKNIVCAHRTSLPGIQ